MVLATHAVIGGAIGRVLSTEPLAALAFGFISHFLLDAVPHWDYELGSLTEDKNKPLNNSIRFDKSFLRDLLKTGIDALLGLGFAWLIFGQSSAAVVAVLLGAIGGLLPDFLQLVYMRFKREPLRSLQRFHLWIHSKVRLDGRPAVGIFLQVALSVAVIIATQTLIESKFVSIFPDLVSSIRLVDILDVAVVAAALYFILLFIKETRSFLIANTVLLLAGLYYVAEHFNLGLVRQLFQPFLTFVIVIFAIVFQRELRRFFEWFSTPHQRIAKRRGILLVEGLESILKAVKIFSDRKIGALIILPREQGLEQIVEGGYSLDGRISLPLLLSIFDTSSPGHDGAVLVEGGRIKRFGLHLPLADKFDRQLGTRHRAALGLAERTDAMVIVVSEERGVVRVAMDGKLITLSAPEELEEVILGKMSVDDSDDAFDYFFLRNFWWKLSAVVLALGLWFVLVFQTGTIRRDFTVPVAFRFVPNGLVVGNLNTDKVTITVSGTKSDLMSFDPVSLSLNLDVSGASIGPAQMAVTDKEVSLPSYLKVESIQPANIRFTLNEEKRRP